MPMAFEDDLAVFFDPEEHGEAVQYNVSPATAIWVRPSGELETPGGRYRIDTNTFLVPTNAIGEAIAGDIITVDRLKLSFRVIGAPTLNDDGTIWTCEVEPA